MNKPNLPKWYDVIPFEHRKEFLADEERYCAKETYAFLNTPTNTPARATARKVILEKRDEFLVLWCKLKCIDMTRTI